MSDISFNTACKELKIAQIVQLNQLFRLLHLAHIHLFQKTLSEITANGSCRTEIARPKGTVVSICGMQAHFSSFDILKTFSFFLWCEMTFFAVVWMTWGYDDKCSIMSRPKRWLQFNSRIVKAHISGIMTMNNWKMIAETRSDIFRWRSRFCRRRVCLSSLLILPYERPTGPGLTWQTIWLAIEGRHCRKPASWELISY